MQKHSTIDNNQVRANKRHTELAYITQSIRAFMDEEKGSNFRQIFAIYYNMNYQSNILDTPV